MTEITADGLEWSPESAARLPTADVYRRNLLGSFPGLLANQQPGWTKSCWSHFGSCFLVASGGASGFSGAFQELQCWCDAHNLAAQPLPERCQYLILGEFGVKFVHPARSLFWPWGACVCGRSNEA